MPISVDKRCGLWDTTHMDNVISLKRVAAQHYETRAVLAGAYVSAMTMLTHAVTVDADGRDASVLCKRVKLDSLADAYALTTEGRQAEPTCQVCATKWKKAMGR